MAMAARTAQSQIIFLDMSHSVPKYNAVQSAFVISAAAAGRQRVSSLDLRGATTNPGVETPGLFAFHERRSRNARR